MTKPKRTLLITGTAFLFICCAILFGCKDKEGNTTISIEAMIQGAGTPPSIDSSIEIASFTKTGAVYTETQKERFNAMLDEQLKCTQSNTGNCATMQGSTTANCSQNFCGSDPCKVKIWCCHKITEGLFNDMTAIKTCGHAVFSYNKVLSVYNATNCNTELIKVLREERDDEYWYVIKDVPYNDTLSNPSGEWKAYYSAPMIRSLLDRSPSEIHIYKGGEVAPDRNLLPILLRFSGTIADEYYDLSNDIP